MQNQIWAGSLWFSVCVALAACSGNDECGCHGHKSEGEVCATSSECQSGLQCDNSVCTADSLPQEDALDEVEVVVPLVPLKWVPVPGGTFMMGCSEGDTQCEDDERPAHQVTVSAFEMLETEVTEGQFEEVLGWKPYRAEGSEVNVDKPMQSFTYSDAVVFCEALGGRFPTEAEWEWAARGGTATRYYCGDNADCLDAVAWHSGNSEGIRHVVRGKAPNMYGLYDMLGNVREWTSDWYDEDYYATSPADNPSGPTDGVLKALRGGGYSGSAEALRVSRRDKEEESDDYGWEDVGFRCVRAPAE